MPPETGALLLHEVAPRIRAAVPFLFAHPAFAAARIFARLAALIVHFFFGAGVGGEVGADDGTGVARITSKGAANTEGGVNSLPSTAPRLR